MNDLLSIDLRPLTDERLGDYLRFFDEKAFTDNPRWAFCYCYFPYHDPDKVDWQRRTGAENRTAITACVRDGTAQGYLAYAGADVVGWCNAAPHRLFPMLRDEPTPDVDTTGTIFCFIVAPAYRNRGISRTLLAAACDGLRSRGMLTVEARPVKDAKGAAANHHGPLSLYLSNGFTIVREDDDGSVLVRKPLS